MLKTTLAHIGLTLPLGINPTRRGRPQKRTELMKIRLGLIAFLIATLTGCFLEITVGDGGEVQSASSLSDCAENSVCSIEILDASFSETFVAVPKPGYRFIGWDDGADYQCKGSFRSICVVENTGFAGNAQAEGVIASSKKYFLKPIFQPVSGPPFSLRDGNGHDVGEIITLYHAGANIIFFHTDEDGDEHGIGGIEVGSTTYIRDINQPLWSNPTCSGDFSHVSQEGLRYTGLPPVFSQEYVHVGDNDPIHLARVAPAEDAQYIVTYYSSFDNCVAKPEAWVLPVTIAVRDIRSLFPEPITLHRN